MSTYISCNHDMKLKKQFSNDSIPGVVFGADVTVPKDCKRERLCEYMLKTVGEKKDFFLSGIIHSTEMYLRANIGGSMKLSSTLTMDDVSFEVGAGIKQTKMSLNGMVKMTRDKQELSFAGMLR